MDGKHAAPCKGCRVVFWGVCTCMAGPMCPAAGYAFFGGARGPRPTGQVRYPPVGDGAPDVPSARQRRAGRRIPTPVCGLARNDSASRCGAMWASSPTDLQEVRANGADRVVRPYKCLSGILVRDVVDAVPYGMTGNGRTTLSARVHSPRCIFSSVSRRMAARSSVR